MKLEETASYWASANYSTAVANAIIDADSNRQNTNATNEFLANCVVGAVDWWIERMPSAHLLLPSACSFYSGASL